MNLIVVAKFFEATYITIFKYLLNAGSQESGLLRPISIYFEIIKING